MLHTKNIASSWGIGLSKEQAALVRKTLGEEHALTLYTSFSEMPKAEPDALRLPSAPHVLWVAAAEADKLPAITESMAVYDEPALMVLLLNQGYDLHDIETAFDNGISDIARPPLTRERIIESMRRALEMRAVHKDMTAMTREIAFERELLERKNSILSFLVDFLARTTENMDLEHLLTTAFSGFSRLLPIRTMHAALWDETSQNPSVTLYISSPQNSRAHEQWRSALLLQTVQNLGELFSIQGICPLKLENQSGFMPQTLPKDGALLALPLVCNREQCGVLLLLMETDTLLGRDQATALDSAVRHLALTVKNARRFMRMCEYADFDALTRVHSRRHFDTRLEEEMQRFTRYGQQFSLLLLDVDHFKQVNDCHGHHIGDTVLREIGEIINSCVRNTDYCARYGGEEFAIILPHTGHQHAMTLADRIREAIAEHVFFANEAQPFHVTASIGVAHTNTAKSGLKLLQEADEALYVAKGEGRNRICFAPAPRLAAVAQP